MERSEEILIEKGRECPIHIINNRMSKLSIVKEKEMLSLPNQKPI